MKAKPHFSLSGQLPAGIANDDVETAKTPGVARTAIAVDDAGPSCYCRIAYIFAVSGAPTMSIKIAERIGR
jgi:hypothetical protein